MDGSCHKFPLFGFWSLETLSYRIEHHFQTSLTLLSFNLRQTFFSFLFVQVGRAKDPVKFLLATEQRARERQVAYETVRLLREDVIECYRKSGINHYTDCKEVNQKYFDLVTQKDMGQLHPKWKNEAKHDGW